MFRDEMSAQAVPSLDGMAQEVLAKGRHARRMRRAKIASTVLVTAGVVGAGIAVPTLTSSGGHPVATNRVSVTKSASPAKSATQTNPSAKQTTKTTPATPTSNTSAGPAAVVLTDVDSPIDYIPQPTGPKAPTTSAAILDELLKLLPPGATSNYALYGLGAQTYLDGASGLGMIRIFLYQGSLNPNACSSEDPSDLTVTCSTLPGGAKVVTTRIDDNCIEPLAIDVDHGDGTVVQVDVTTCLAWNGSSNPPSPMAITAAQALQIAANPAWGASKMDAALVQDAASRFADVPAGT
jgi:hypothetical protein